MRSVGRIRRKYIASSTAYILRTCNWAAIDCTALIACVGRTIASRQVGSSSAIWLSKVKSGSLGRRLRRGSRSCRDWRACTRSGESLFQYLAPPGDVLPDAARASPGVIIRQRRIDWRTQVAMPMIASSARGTLSELRNASTSSFLAYMASRLLRARSI